MKKRFLLIALLALAVSFSLIACDDLVEEMAPEPEAPAVEEPVAETFAVENGRYRGTYRDRGMEQVGIQFDVEDGVFTAITFRELKYGDFGYRSLPEDAPDLVKAYDTQYRQAIDYLVGKNVADYTVLYSPGDFVADIDAASGATIRGNKIASAIKDALNRGLYTPADAASINRDLPDYDDGRYRGVYYDRGMEQVGVQFDVKDGLFTAVSFRELQYGDINYRSLPEDAPEDVKAYETQYRQAIEYLVGKPLPAIFDLYTPGDFVDDVDAASGATIRSNKIFSAINDGLNRGLYSPGETFNKDLGTIEDGRYRGTYSDRNIEQVGVQFVIENGTFASVTFRELKYGDYGYRALPEDAPEAVKAYDTQYRQAIAYLEGKPVSAVFDLYSPGEFVEDIDTATGATIRANKIFSAIIDGLNRGIY